MYFRILIKSRSISKREHGTNIEDFHVDSQSIIVKLMKIIRFETNERQITRRVKASKP